MRILFIVPYPSEGASNRLRVEQYLPYLSSRGIEFTVRPFVGRALYKILYAKGKRLAKAFLFVLCLINRIADLVRSARYDVVFIHREALPVGSTAIEAAFRMMQKRIVFDFDDAIFLPSTSMFNDYAERFKDPGKVSRIISISDSVIAGNAYLAEYARKFNRNVTVVPTPIDTVRCAPVERREGPGRVTVGWIGSMTTRVYLEPLEGVFRKLAQAYPNARFVFVGNWTGLPSRVPGVVYKEWDLASELDDVRSFDIGIMPMPDDMWTKGKCGFKILLYMSCAVAVVTSPVGVNREIVRDGENGLWATTDEEWYRQIARLIEDGGLRKRLADRGRGSVEERYSVASLAPRFLAAIEAPKRGAS